MPVFPSVTAKNTLGPDHNSDESDTCTPMTALTQEEHQDTRPDVEAGSRVLRTEGAAILALADSLGEAFVGALDILDRVSGRVIVTGIGKSGHVGRKIAATLASTGTPAQFVHAAEASHGDLGMITSADAVLALSNSGETGELSDLIAYTRRFQIGLIAVTSRADSTLAEAGDVALVLPTMPEACPMGLAPTTSTTMMLALGDALSVALLERKGFSAQDFHMFHPGGKLGRQLLRMRDLMHTGDLLPLASGDPLIADILEPMTEKRFGCMGIVDPDGRLEGIITDGDMLRHMTSDLLRQRASEVMTTNPVTATPDALAGDMLALMNERKIGALFVVEGGRPIGIVHFHDFLRAGVA